jgi:hypothetical protein
MTTAQEEAAKHWEYVEALMIALGTQKSIIDISRFQYISSFVHGWKHGQEIMK